MTEASVRHCVIYTRKSTDEGLDQAFNSLHAQREACEAFIRSQRGEGWSLRRDRYDDGGYSGAGMDRPALKRLLAEVGAGRVDVVVVYKVDRLTRSLTDFAKIIEIFDKTGVSFVSVTQAFNTTTSMGRLTLNVLLSFAQFEREVTAERIRDKITASKAKGMWMGGQPPLGYDPPTGRASRALVVNEAEARTVRLIFQRYLELGNCLALQRALQDEGIRSKRRATKSGRLSGGFPFSRGALRYLLRNRTYLGEIVHRGASYPGRHPAIVNEQTFAAVQEILDQTSLERRRRVPRAANALLHGLLFDGDGQPMDLLLAQGRAGRQYRYYVSLPARSLGENGVGDDAIRRTPAAAIEELVLRRLSSIVRAPEEQLDRQTFRAWIARVEIHASAVDLVIRTRALGAQAGDPISMDDLRRHLAPGEQVTLEPHDVRLIRVRLPIRLKLWGGRTWILGPDGQAREPMTLPDRSAIRKIRAAHAILKACRADPDGPVAQLRFAQSPGGSGKLAAVRWAFLAPDIQQAVLEGRARCVPASAMTRIPLLWSEQRGLFRISQSNEGTGRVGTERGVGLRWPEAVH
jgi:site-specific DNA recombinase